MNHEAHVRDTKFSYAVRGGDVALVKQFLADGADVNSMATGLGALHIAASNRQVELCELLIGAGANVSEAAMDGNTPLHCAVAAANGPLSLEVIRCLLEAGADVNAGRRHDSFRPLHLLGRGDDNRALAAAEMMVRYGAVSNAGHMDGVGRSQLVGRGWVYLTPFQEAILHRRPELAEFYMTHCGERLDQLTADGRTLFDVAGDRPERVSMLVALQIAQGIGCADESPAVRRSGALALGSL
jgi:ankyrin repeat protein